MVQFGSQVSQMITNATRCLSWLSITTICLLLLVACRSSIKSLQQGGQGRAPTQVGIEDRSLVLTALVRHIADSMYYRSTPAPRFVVFDPNPELALISTELKGLQVLQITNLQQRPEANKHQNVVRDVIVALRGPLDGSNGVSGAVVIADRGSVLYQFTMSRTGRVWNIERWQPVHFVD